MVINLNWMEGPSSFCFVSHAVNMMCLISFCLPKLMTGRQRFWNASSIPVVSHFCTATVETTKKLLQQLQKYQSFKTRLQLTLLPLILCLYKFYLFSCVTCTLKSTVVDDSNLSQPHSWSRICTGNVYSQQVCWRRSSRAQYCDSSPW